MTEIKSNRAWREECESLRQQLASRDAEIAELNAEIERKMSAAKFVLKECDILRDQVTLLRDALKYSRHQCEELRVWGGMSWSYHPFQAKRIFDACEKALTATEQKP